MPAATPHPDWEPLPWDTACFGFPTARLRAELSPRALGPALADLRAAGFRLAYWNADPGDSPGLAAATALGGTRVDERLLYELEPIGWDPPAPDRTGSKPAEPGKAGPVGSGSEAPGPGAGRAVDALGRGWDAALEDLAVLAGAYSRFRVDARFPSDRFQALYREWMRKSLSGERADAVLALPGGEGQDGAEGPQGFVTLAAREGRGSIGLIAVAPSRQRLGLGSELMRAASAWFREKDCRSASVVTQAANAAACALYQRHGYRVARREIIFHFWL